MLRSLEQWSTEMNTFQVGRSYATRSIGDYDCIFRFTVLARTAKTVTVYDPTNRRNVKRGLSIWQGNEQFSPFGRYSMSPIVGADDLEVAS